MDESPQNPIEEAKRPVEEAKPQRRLCSSYALVYAAIVPVVQKIARKHGYAVAIHGSMATDLDLLACPWTEEASDAETLMEAIRAWFGLVYQETHQTNPTRKPHGRLAWSLMFDPANEMACGGPYLDISIMPRLPK